MAKSKKDITIDIKPGKNTLDPAVDASKKKAEQPVEVPVKADTSGFDGSIDKLYRQIEKIASAFTGEVKYVNKQVKGVKFESIEISLARIEKHLAELKQGLNDIDFSKLSFENLDLSKIDKVTSGLDQIGEKLTEISSKILNKARPEDVIKKELDEVNAQIKQTEENSKKLANLKRYISSEANNIYAAVLNDQEGFGDLIDEHDLQRLEKHLRKYIELGGRIQDLGNVKGNIKGGDLNRESYKDFLDELSDITGKDFSFVENAIPSVDSLTTKVQELETELKLAQQASDSVKVEIDNASIESLSEAISGLKVIFGDNENISLGINTEDVEKITTAFDELKNVVIEIRDLLQNIDVVNIAPEQVGEQISRIGQQLQESGEHGSSSLEKIKEEMKETGNEAEQETQKFETLAEKLEYLKKIKSESRFMENAEERLSDMEDKGWDAGGNHPKSEQDSLNKIRKYEELKEHIESANQTLDEFEEKYDKVIITMKNGDVIEVNDLLDLDGLSLAKNRIRDIEFVLSELYQTTEQQRSDNNISEQLHEESEEAQRAAESERELGEARRQADTNSSSSNRVEDLKEEEQEVDRVTARVEELSNRFNEFDNKPNIIKEKVFEWRDAIQKGLYSDPVELFMEFDKASIQNQLKTIAWDIADEWNKTFGTSITGNDVIKAYNNVQKAAEKAAKAEEKAADKAEKAKEKEKEKADKLKQQQDKIAQRNRNTAANKSANLESSVQLSSMKLDKLTERLSENEGLANKFSDRIKELRNNLESIGDNSGLKYVNNQIKELTADIDNEIKAIEKAAKAEEKAEQEAKRKADKQKERDDTKAKKAADHEQTTKELATYKEEEAILRKIYDLKIANANINIGDAQKAENDARINRLLEEQKQLQENRKNSYQENAQAAEHLLEIEKQLNTQVNETARTSIVKDIDKQVGAIDNVLAKPKILDTYKDKLIDLKKQIQEFSQMAPQMDTSQLEQQWRKLKETIDESIGEKAFRANQEAARSSLEKLRKNIADIKADNSAMGKDFENRFNKLEIRIDTAKSNADVEQLKADIVALETELVKAGKTGSSFFDTLGNRIKQMSTNFIAMHFSLYDIVRYFREAAEQSIKVDTALTELRKVSDATPERLEQSFRNASETAQELGSSISDVINITADWSRLNKIGLLYGNV